RDNFCYQISRLHPAQLIECNPEPGLDFRKRARDNLDVEDRHEHANAHRGEPNPGLDPPGALPRLHESHRRGLSSAVHIPRRGARTRSSIRMRRPISTALSAEKVAPIATAPKARGSTAISATTSR